MASPVHTRILKAMNALHYVSPPITIIYWLVASTVSVCMLQGSSTKVIQHKARRTVVTWLLVGVITTYVSLALQN